MGQDYWLALACGLLALIVYLFTLAPTVTGEDSGELITAAYSLGIPHPPGYPTWTLLAHFFTWLPIGSVAWRVNLSSAVFAAATVSLLCLLIRRLGMGRIGAVGGALAFAFSREFWEQAVIAEVYALNALFFCGLILLLLVWRDQRRDGQLLVFAVLYGLSLGVHNTMHLCAPFFAVFVLAVERPPLRRWCFYFGLTGIALSSAFLIYCYLPLRSLANPAVDWGNPETLQNWWAMVARKQYAFMMTQYPRSPDHFGEQIQMMWGLWSENVDDSILFVLFGAAYLAFRRPWLSLWLWSLGWSIALTFLLVQNPQLDKEWRWVMGVFPIPLYIVSAAAMGAFYDFLTFHAAIGKEKVAPEKGWSWKPNFGNQVFATGLAFLSVVMTLNENWKANDKSDYFWAEDYGKNLLNSLPQDAIFIAEPDHAAFSTLYLKAVEGLRPDVTLGRKYGYLNMDLAPELIPQYGEFPKRRYDPEILAYVLDRTHRPVYVQSEWKLPKGIRLQQAGLLFRVLRPGETLKQRDWWRAYHWHALDWTRTRGDYTAELILLEVAFAQAREAMDRGDAEEGWSLLFTGIANFGEDYNALNNAGVLCGQHGLREEARSFFERAIKLDPARGTAQRNLERVK